MPDGDRGLERKRDGVKTLGAEADSRRRGADASAQLRKAKMEESANKRRGTAPLAPGDAEESAPSSDGLAASVEACQSRDASAQARGVRQLRRLLSASDSLSVRDVLATGVLPRLVSLLSSHDALVALDACCAVTDVASTDAAGAVMDAGALAPLVAGMTHGDAAIREQSISCLGNVAGDGPALRDAVLATPGAVQNLLQNLRSTESLHLLRSAAWTLANFCRGSPPPPQAAIQPLLPALAHLIAIEDAAVAADALWGLCFLMAGDEALVAAIAAAPAVLSRVAALLGHGELAVAMPALRITGNVLSSDEAAVRQAGVDAGALAALVPLLASPHRDVRREACWAVSAVAAGTAQQIDAVLANRDLLDAVLKALRGGDWHVRKEAAWIVCNAATAGTPRHVCELVARGAIEPLVSLLAGDDARMTVVVLDAMTAILVVEARFHREGNPAAAMCDFAAQLEAYGAVGRLEELQGSATSAEIRDKAYALLLLFEDNGGVGDAENQPAAAAAARQKL